MNICEIENYWILTYGSGAVIIGEVYGHPLYFNGQTITTALITAINMNELLTQDGFTYRVGTPHLDYIKWCKDNGQKEPKTY
jgi:hypothetical protein